MFHNVFIIPVISIRHELTVNKPAFVLCRKAARYCGPPANQRLVSFFPRKSSPCDPRISDTRSLSLSLFDHAPPRFELQLYICMRESNLVVVIIHPLGHRYRSGESINVNQKPTNEIEARSRSFLTHNHKYIFIFIYITAMVVYRKGERLSTILFRADIGATRTRKITRDCRRADCARG